MKILLKFTDQQQLVAYNSTLTLKNINIEIKIL